MEFTTAAPPFLVPVVADSYHDDCRDECGEEGGDKEGDCNNGSLGKACRRREGGKEGVIKALVGAAVQGKRFYECGI